MSGLSLSNISIDDRCYSILVMENTIIVNTIRNGGVLCQFKIFIYQFSLTCVIIFHSILNWCCYKAIISVVMMLSSCGGTVSAALLHLTWPK